jgi:hypothetical protein
MTPQALEAAALCPRCDKPATRDSVSIACNHCKMLFTHEIEVMRLRDRIEELSRHAAAAEGSEPITYDEVEAMFADEAVTVSQRNGQVGVCIDHWIPLRTKGDAQIVKSVLNITLTEKQA